MTQPTTNRNDWVGWTPLTPCTVGPELTEIQNLFDTAQARVDAGKCRVYWGTHGCQLPRAHDTEREPHLCSCADDPEEPGVTNAGRPPYYGPDTWFYGEDAPEQARPT